MIFRIMTRHDASAVCWNDINMAENSSLVRWPSPEDHARDLFDFSRESWALVDKDGEPQAVCGVTTLSRTTVTAWCIVGTRNKKVWGHLARKAREIAGRLFSTTGIKRIHSTACLSRSEPLKYLLKLGMKELCRMPDYGAGGRDFALMAVTKEEWLS